MNSVFYQQVIWSKDADQMANSVDNGQTAPSIWFYTVCPDLSVWIPRIIMAGDIWALSQENLSSVFLTR